MSQAQASIQQTTVLIIEDELQVRRALRAALRTESYLVVEAASAIEGLERLTVKTPHLVLLDLGLPDMDGIEVTRKIREQSNVPIIVVSVRGDETNQVDALDSGANDYITKPVREAEFLARIRAVLRNGDQAKGSSVLVTGALRADAAQQRVWVNSEEVVLTPLQFRLLYVLMEDAGRVVTHRRLLQRVWGVAHLGQVEYLRVYVSQLRAKIERSPARPKFLVTAPGIGYRLKVTD